MSSTFELLFPIVAMVAIIGLILYSLYLKKVEKEKPLKAKEARLTQPSITVVGIETGPPLAPVLKEGFANEGMVFPRWSGASMRFGFGMNDRYYKEYSEQNLSPSAEMIERIKSLPVSDKVVPNYGSSLSNFDADITAIPWDADNVQYLERDVVWGHITHDASSSIFLKAYHRKLLSDPANLLEGEKAAEYYSPVLSMRADNTSSAALLQAADAAAAMVGQAALDSVKSRLEEFVKNTKLDELASSGKLDTILRDKRNSGKAVPDFDRLSPKDKAIVQSICDSTDRHEARKAKLASGQALSAAEEVQHKIYNKHNGHLNPTEKPKYRPGNIGKIKVPISSADKMKVGIKNAIKFMKNQKAAIKAAAAMTKKMAIVVARMFMTKTITAILAVFAATTTAGAAATLGALAPLAIIANILAFTWGVLDTVSTIAITTLQVLLPTLMDRAMKNGSLCPEGKPIDILINDDFLYFIVSELIPFGGVMDAFGPYTCYKSDGSIVLKTPLYIPPYFADSSLSVYKHSYPANKRPRGDSTTYKSNTDSLPAGWKVVAGLARSPCDPGTWTSSEVDMLCNISTYVPQTYTKKSKVPVTDIKVSRVPETRPKATFITTYPRVVDGVTSKIADYEPCETYQAGAQANAVQDCWGN
jgi:hypothetical protein